MSVHDVVVFTGEIPLDPQQRMQVGDSGHHANASVAICRDCPWRGEVRGSPQSAAADRIQHLRATGLMG